MVVYTVSFRRSPRPDLCLPVALLMSHGTGQCATETPYYRVLIRLANGAQIESHFQGQQKASTVLTFCLK